MKKIVLVISLIFASSFAFAQFTGSTQSTPGGYTGPAAGATASTVQQAKSLRDDTPISLRGKITEHLRKDKYLFTDGTGEIVIEIDHDKWHGQSVGPNDTVEIRGEIDKDFHSTEIDVDYIQKLNP